MTEERLGLARGNVTKADASTVSCVHGHIEAIQVPDVIIWNCVVNPSTDSPTSRRHRPFDLLVSRHKRARDAPSPAAQVGPRYSEVTVTFRF